ISDWVLSDDIVLHTMAINMKLKFEKYWDVMNCLLAIGSILDPRYKMKTIQFYYPLVYGEMASFEIEKLKKKLYDLVEEYKKKSKQFQKEKSSQSSSSRPPVPKRSGYADKFDLYYILCWWKTNEIKRRFMHDVAKDVLAIPVSTVASESTFSTGGRVLSAHRNRLHPKTVEALMCARDWLWSEMQGIRYFLNEIISNSLSCFFICNVCNYFDLLDSTTSKDQSFDDDSDIEVSNK
ncbi:hypothetical protein F511_36149, partial [Dorcoceras hygrometricum]